MSFSLYYRPVPKERPPTHELPIGLKYVIARRFFDHDGSLRGQIVVTKAHLEYLQGIADGAGGEEAEGALELIQAVREHERVELWIGDEEDLF